jgi:magnesium chelatase family protein
MNRAAVYPARFMLVAATNPCPCGYAGAVERCRCSEADLARHRRRLSGPLLDRIDLLVNLGGERSPCLAASEASSAAQHARTSSLRARERVLEARERQLARGGAGAFVANGRLDAAHLRAHARLDDRGAGLLLRAQEHRLLSSRGAHRTLRVARTVADLSGSERVRSEHVAIALALRPDPCASIVRAA